MKIYILFHKKLKCVFEHFKWIQPDILLNYKTGYPVTIQSTGYPVTNPASRISSYYPIS